jgi:hypothetical protein
MNEQLICIHYHRIIVLRTRTPPKQDKSEYEKPFNFTFFPGAMTMMLLMSGDDDDDDDGLVGGLSVRLTRDCCVR